MFWGCTCNLEGNLWREILVFVGCDQKAKNSRNGKVCQGKKGKKTLEEHLLLSNRGTKWQMKKH